MIPASGSLGFINSTCVTLIFKFSLQSSFLFAWELASFYEFMGIKSIWLRAEQWRKARPGVSQVGVWAEHRDSAKL